MLSSEHKKDNKIAQYWRKILWTSAIQYMMDMNGLG